MVDLVQYYSLLEVVNCVVKSSSGQASVSVAEHYSVLAPNVSGAQLRHAPVHSKVRYFHMSEDLSEDDVVTLVSGEGLLDLIAAATAVHWLDVPMFYAVVKGVLRKPGCVFAVWGYNLDIDQFGSKLQEQPNVVIRPYIDQRGKLAFDQHRELPFPFKPIGMGWEGKPADMDTL
ncbi:putative methyltransferase DDB_G0268948, partial [Triticum aestivum]|uniref:putative methyltransferase DDB_G0268948 n=1 Tax=Triticum aestivum TaxID=4565 RepID=UPI001D01D17D